MDEATPASVGSDTTSGRGFWARSGAAHVAAGVERNARAVGA